MTEARSVAPSVARTRFAGAFLAAFVALFPARADAQIVNVQPLIAGNDDKQGPTVAIDASADIRRGNTNLVTLSGSAIGQYRAGRHLLFAMARVDYGSNERESFMNKDIEHVRYRVDIRKPLSADAFLQHDRDAFRRLSLRMLAGAGPRVEITDQPGFELAFGAAYMLEREVLSPVPGESGPSAGDDTTAHRLSASLVATTGIGEAFKLGVTMYAQPRWDRFRDVRVLCETTALSKATKHLSLKLSLTSAYDSEPPAGVAPLDTTLKGALQVSF